MQPYKLVDVLRDSDPNVISNLENSDVRVFNTDNRLVRVAGKNDFWGIFGEGNQAGLCWHQKKSKAKIETRAALRTDEHTKRPRTKTNTKIPRMPKKVSAKVKFGLAVVSLKMKCKGRQPTNKKLALTAMPSNLLPLPSPLRHCREAKNRVGSRVPGWGPQHPKHLGYMYGSDEEEFVGWGVVPWCLIKST